MSSEQPLIGNYTGVNEDGDAAVAGAGHNDSNAVHGNVHPIESIMESSELIIDDLTAQQVEHYFFFCLKESNRLAKSKEAMTRDVAMAKMVNYCVRMLHSNGWVPRTVVRAMVHMEAGTEKSVKGILYQAMREKQHEGRVRKAQKAADAEAAGGVSQGNRNGVSREIENVAATASAATGMAYGSEAGNCSASGSGSRAEVEIAGPVDVSEGGAIVNDDASQPKVENVKGGNESKAKTKRT